MVITIHQPEHLPWLGFFAKAALADVLVLLDDVQYRKNYFQNRNRIRTAQGATWLSVPVTTRKHSTLISEVEIANSSSPRWASRHWRTIQQSYASAPYYGEHEPFFRDHYARPWRTLAATNEVLIAYLLRALSVNVEVVRASDLGCLSTGRTTRLVEICRVLKASTYVSGVSGREYLDLDAFRDAGIAVEFQDFRHPVYEQCYEPFMPCMSAVDLLFNHGPRSARILRGVDTETLDTVFD